MARFLGQVPGAPCNDLAPYLSTSENTGRVMAEELFRDEHTREIMLKIVAGLGRKLSTIERASLPALLGGVTWETIAHNYIAGE